jgi:hypothetical protein
VITVKVSRTGKLVEWRRFGFEDELQLADEPLVDFSAFERIGPFQFDEQQYREALLNPPPKPA